MLLRFLAAILAALRLCCGDLPAFSSAPGCPLSSPEADGGPDSALLGGDNVEDGTPPLPSDPSLVVSDACAAVSVWPLLSPRVR